jgi:hypothetical protein
VYGLSRQERAIRTTSRGATTARSRSCSAALRSPSVRLWATMNARGALTAAAAWYRL